MRRKAGAERTQVSGKRRGRRAACAGLITVGALALALTLFTLSNRPHWRTLTLRAGQGKAVAMDCPDNWKVVSEDNDTANQDSTCITLRHDPPTGWFRWWNAHITHVSEHSFNNPEIRVEVQTGHGPITSPLIRIQFDTGMPVTSIIRSVSRMANSRRNVERVSHSLGPAIRRTADIDLNTPGRATPGGKVWLPRHIEALNIYPSETKGQNIGLVTVSCAAPAKQYPDLRPLFDRVMKSIRLVK